MSTFLGLIEEIPGISIDCFDDQNLNSSVFFLSHCHTDHMRGLNNKFFVNLQKTNKFFYCSHITKSFLENCFWDLKNPLYNKHIVELPLEESIILNYIHNDKAITFTVSSISSGHCPGAFMFLFHVNDKRILYTGDFRINKEDYSKLKSLHYDNKLQQIPLSIDKIYLDTTFLSLNFPKFPSRQESSKELCNAVKDWIEKDPRNVVILEISALYGSEFIYMELSKMLNKKIHVKDKVYRIYSQMEILANCVTDVGSSTSIHTCTNKTFGDTLGLKCRTDIDHENILTIIPSVMKWSGKDTSSVIEWDTKRKQTKNVCYATHASYDELEAFIQYFKPKEVFPCVCHEKDKKTIENLLKSIMTITESNKNTSKLNTLNFSKYKLFHDCNVISNIISDDEDEV